MFFYVTSKGLKSQARFYALNILEELDDSNEVMNSPSGTLKNDAQLLISCCCFYIQYYVDRGSGIMYLFKPSAGEVVS